MQPLATLVPRNCEPMGIVGATPSTWTSVAIVTILLNCHSQRN
jgi:hypothetical protein